MTAIKMTRNEFIDIVSALVASYIADEEMYDDNAQIVVNPADCEVTLHDGDEDIDDALDQYDVMDLLQMGIDGQWVVDAEVIRALADQYFEN